MSKFDLSNKISILSLEEEELVRFFQQIAEENQDELQRISDQRYRFAELLIGDVGGRNTYVVPTVKLSDGEGATRELYLGDYGRAEHRLHWHGWRGGMKGESRICKKEYPSKQRPYCQGSVPG